ncbi:hypothetical protein CH330_07450 [candidate division WOR-3 bacterium JGI_Cruoil_03_51_56]|uniref:Bifunctional protein FolD n=1 Tax=candidate division WOR-3 bacterium JGI_Cruoil_03_51_56 TaxID=1973747 RepID=A0A235BQW3_UNCW3|nr:MAG: hypothetical protein CH330_07450 [candidate division WOR-3 bacterium JGI_Cruoil_03_51_56]
MKTLGLGRNEVNKGRIIAGKAIARTVQKEIAAKAARLIQKGIFPKLGIILSGSGPSQIYAHSKERACAKVGIRVETVDFPADVKFEDLKKRVEKWNREKSVHGIIVQMPLPDKVDSARLLGLVDPAKDVDCLTPANLGMLVAGRPRFLPATPAGIVELLVRSQIRISGQRVVIIGRSEVVGKPLANILLLRGKRGDATVTVCHTKTRKLTEISRGADILIVAAGKPRFVKKEMVKHGAVVVDVGINQTDRGLVGDVDFEDVAPEVSAITPVPGGVGPMTVAMLLSNTVAAAAAQTGEADNAGI